MYNYNSPIIQNMIMNGQLNTATNYNPYSGGMMNVPQQQVPYQQQQPQQFGYGGWYNPSQEFNNSNNNIIPFGNDNYNNQPQQFGYNYQPQYQYNQQQEYTFAPIGGYNQPQQFGYNYQPQYQYNQQFGYNGYNNYGFNPVYNIDPFLLSYMNKNGEVVFMNPNSVQISEYNNIQSGMIRVNKLKARMCAKFCNNDITEEQLDEKFNPNNPKNIRKREENSITPEQIEMRKMQQITDLLKYPCMETEAMRRARLIHDMSANFHKMYDGVGMFDFLENELWKFQREWWIEDNINMKSSRDLSQQYKQRSYMDLLNMHRSTNPYVNDLLSNSKYDNNVDDMEIGLPSVLATADQRRRQILEGRVPQFISSAETQKQRNKYFSELTSMIRAKEQQRAGGGNNV